MPFLGIGLHVIIALFFAVHAVRNGQPIFWLIVLFSFPVLGSIVYFLVVYMPTSRLERGAQKVISSAIKTLNPGKELREARSAFDYAPTAQHQMRLASALLEMGQAEEAATHYEACLKGPFASDLNIRLGAARAYLACERYAESLNHLELIRQKDPNFRAEQISLLTAKALTGANRRQDARAEFESAMAKFGSFEVRAEYAIWAVTVGDMETAGKLQIEIQRAMERWNRHTREMNRELVVRLNTALNQVTRAN